MRAMLEIGVVSLIVAGMTSAQDGDKDAKALIDKAIKAAGGAENLNKHGATLVKAKGKITIMNMELPFSGEFAFQQPDKFRHVVEVEINGQKFTNTQVFDGKKAWMNILGETKELDDEKLIAEFKEAVHAQRVFALAKLNKGFSFSTVGEVKVKNKPAQGVRVSYKGRRDVNLFFDKDKNQLVKVEYRTLDPITMKEVGREEYVSDFKDVMGIRTPHKLVVLHDGEQFLDATVTEVRYLDRHDEGVFAKP
jgi:hypothetical protein